MDNSYTSNQSFYSPEDLKSNMRILWSEQIMWTRFFIVSVINNLKDVDVLTNRLFEIPRDLSNVFRIYYGNTISDYLEILLREQISLTINLINEYVMEGANAENSPSVADIVKKLHDNANQIALLLSCINPNWNHQMIQKLLYDQLDMTKDELYKLITGQYADDVYLYEFIEYHTLLIADIISNGIIKQFQQ